MVYFVMKGYGKIEPPEYLRDRSQNLPEKILHTRLHLATVRKPPGKFVMPVDRYDRPNADLLRLPAILAENIDALLSVWAGLD
jgi:hypothetical protein